jgi:hypothetical protein
MRSTGNVSGRFATRVSAIQRKFVTGAGRRPQRAAGFSELAARLGKATDQVRRSRHGRRG